MIDYDSFGKIKLSDYNLNNLKTSIKPDWEWMNCSWYCEQIGFSWTGQLSCMKEITGALELDLNTLTPEICNNIFNRMNITLKKGQTEKQIEKLFGQPVNIDQFVDDRKSFEYIYGTKDKYYISCTIHNYDGLVFVSIMRYDLFMQFNEF